MLNVKRASAPGGGSGGGKDGPGGAGAAAKGGKPNDPIDDFVLLENELAGELVTAVDSALSSLKKVMAVDNIQ